MTMRPLLKDCDIAGPIMPCLILDQGDVEGTMTLSCPCCHEKVYENVRIVADHVFFNWGHQAMWFSKVLKMEIHRCHSYQYWDIEELAHLNARNS